MPAARLAAVLSLTAACAPALSSFQPAHVGPKGTVKASVGLDVSVPTGSIANTLDIARSLAGAARSRMLSEEEKLTIFTAGLRLTLNAPALVEHFRVSYNPLDRLEASLRYAGGALALGGRYQLLTQERHGTDLSVGLGVARFSYGFPIDSLIDVIDLDDFARWNYDVPITFGWHDPAYRAWIGPRIGFYQHSSQLVLRAPGGAGNVASTDVARATGGGHYLGLQLGGALGYAAVFLGLELTVVRVAGDARLDVFGRMANADTAAWVFVPGVALMGEL